MENNTMEEIFLDMGSEAQQLHIFFLPLMAHGHMIPMIDIARLFSVRGIKSTIITTPLNVLHFKESIDRDKQSGLDIGVQIIAFPSVEAGLPEGCESVDSVTTQTMIFTFFQSLGLLQPQFELLLEKLRPDCIVADTFFTWTTDVAKKHGIPRILFHGTNNFSPCVVENIKRYAPQENVASDSDIFVVPGLPDHIQTRRSQLPDGGGTSRNVFSDMTDKMQETELTSFGILVNSFQELEISYAEYYKKDMGRRTWNIGPVSLNNRNFIDKAQRGKKASVDENHCLSWLDSKDPKFVLYVSFGSMSRFSTAQLLEIAMGIEASDVSFIWVVRMDEGKDHFLPVGFEERMGRKGLIFKDWAPQVLILEHPAVGGFMTHCGWNSILEGICTGIPFITWPVFAEQFNNEMFVTQVLKIGIEAGNKVWTSWVEPKDVSVTRDRVEEVVTQLMGNGEAAENQRRRARQLQEMAKKVMGEGGSSYNNLSALITELRVQKQQHRK